MATDVEVAKWMFERLKADGQLSHRAAVSGIREQFGDQFLYKNENSNLAISKSVLKELTKLHAGTVKWVSHRRQHCWCWLKTESEDAAWPNEQYV